MAEVANDGYEIAVGEFVGFENLGIVFREEVPVVCGDSDGLVTSVDDSA